MKLESYIRTCAIDLGFAGLGIARASESRTFDAFNRWVEQGFHGGMEYLARHSALRKDPRLIFPEAESIVAVAAAYPLSSGHPGWSSYAVGRDYHDVIRERLHRLAEQIAVKIPDEFKYRVCVDTAPLLEREWAVRAGLGWIGKQGSLVNPEAGTCVFIGVLMVNIALEPMAEIPNRCGDCRACLDACPTGALRADGWLDARRCISYLTIEHKGALSSEFRAAFGGSLYGCDRCTAVCPFNGGAARKVMPEFEPDARQRPSAAETLAMSPAEFDQRFAGTAVARIGLETLQRNARFVQGCSP